MKHNVLIAAALLLAAGSCAAAQESALFVAQGNQVLKLVDLNRDGDFFDFAESAVYADNLPAGVGAIDGGARRLFVLVPNAAAVLVVEDRNADGDALDFAEVALYAQLPDAQPQPIPAGLACHPDGTLLTTERTTGKVYRAVDLNGDGDALDAGELLQVAADLSAPSAIAARPDGRVLVAQALGAIPVRILHDRNSDGDFFDFAENLSYAENIALGVDLVAPQNHVAYLTRPADGLVTRLQDLTADDDVLDYAEVVPHADGLSMPTAIAAGPAGSLFVAAQDPAGTLYRLQDLNGDGDALDFAEALVVGDGLNQPTGIVYVAAECLKGDIDGDGLVDLNDVAPFVEVLLGTLVPPDPCPADLNSDGRIDGADIGPFSRALLP